MRSVQYRFIVASLALTACTFEGEPPELGPDAGEPTVDAAEPPALLTGAPGEWVWNDIPGAQCGNAAQTGIGVNIGTSDDVLVYLEGGGLCWDELSCALALPPIPGVTGGFPLASYFTDGFTAATFQRILGAGGYASGIFDRTLANNPWKDATLVYVPYCTGDVHTGRTQAFFPVTQRVGHFAGRTNLELALAALHDTLPPPSRVTLAGSSAGAYGATFNYPLVADTFASARVDLVADSGPILPFSPFLQLGYAAWDTKAIIPGCTECIASFDHLYAHYAQTYPASRFAFVTHAEDLVIAAGHLQLPFPVFSHTMKHFTQHVLGPLANWRSFVAGGTAHTSVYNLLEPSVQTAPACLVSVLGVCLYAAEVEVSRTVLADWLTQMQADDPAWTTVTSLR